MTPVGNLDRHELSRLHRDGIAVDHDPSVTGDDGIDVIVSVLEVIVGDCLSARR